MVDRKKVCYTLDRKVIDLIDQRSALEKKTKSQVVTDCIKYGYSIMMGEYKSNGRKPLSNVDKKREKTIPRSYTIPLDVIETLDFFSDKLGMKKSHLVLGCVMNFENRTKASDNIDDLMDFIIEYYGNRH